MSGSEGGQRDREGKKNVSDKLISARTYPAGVRLAWEWMVAGGWGWGAGGTVQHGVGVTSAEKEGWLGPGTAIACVHMCREKALLNCSSWGKL